MTGRTWLVYFAILLATTPIQAQPNGPVKGVVWAPPESVADIRSDLQSISEHGVEAVRLPLVFDPNMHIVAGLFGVELFQELDARFLPHDRLTARRDEIVAALDSALEIASQADGRHVFGLGYWIDTSVQSTCVIIQELSDRVRQRIPDAQTYYVSAFVESDHCSDAVDFVLLGTTGEMSGVDLVRRWRLHRDTPVGLAAVGFPVREDSGYGYRAQYSAEYQARMLESQLRVLLNDEQLHSLFVDRWSDDPSVPVNHHGILTVDDSPRAAATVLRGMYTGEQTAFALDAGTPSGNDFSWINLISFLSVALFGLTYYGSLGLRSIVRRYFLSHSIYIEKLADGREATVGTSMFLLLCLSLAASIVGMTVMTDLSGTRLWHPLLHWLPEWLSDALALGVARSGLLVPVFAAMFAFVTLLWAALLSLSTRGTKHLRLGQTLLIAVMPRWPVALIGLLALVMLNWQIDAPGFVLVAVMGFWFAVVLIYTGRMLSDFLRLLGIGALWTIPVLLLALVFVSALVWLIVVTNDLRPELAYFWHIARGT